MATLDTILKSKPIVRVADLRAAGIDQKTVHRKVMTGELVSLCRGVVATPDAESDQHAYVAALQLLSPSGVLALEGAAVHHGMTEALPRHIHWMVPKGRVLRAMRWPLVKFIQVTNSAAFEIGIETFDIQGIPVRVTTPARTVVDMWHPRYGSTAQHAMFALNTFAVRSADGNALSKLARLFGAADEMMTAYEAALHVIDHPIGRNP